MPDSPTSESDFVCDCEESMRSACAEEPFYKQHEGKRYCVLHFPSKEKSADFEEARRHKLEKGDFHFEGVWFPNWVSFAKSDFTADAHFRSATFSEGANFMSATFSAAADFSLATFSAGADFTSATFNAAADFSHATFSVAAYFSSATFSAAVNFGFATFTLAAYFSSATFSAAADFSHATFSADTDFSFATFRKAAYFRCPTFSAGAYFRRAAFRDYVEFSGDKNRQVVSATSPLDLQSAKIEKPDHVSFHTLTLHPHWFININARRFDFINVHWNNGGKAKPELELLKGKDVPSPHRLLAIACRRLSANAEENDRYREASNFRRMASDAERLETWRGFDLRRLNWWYWLASGYGERPFQALVVLMGIFLIFGLLYTRVGFARWEPRLASEADAMTAARDAIGTPLKFSRALTYSAGVMTLQKPDPRPATTAAQTVVLLETILGPVQAALLALAIRRKFMK